MVPHRLAKLAAVLAAAALRAALAAAPAPARAQAPERLFYYVDREDSYESFVRHVDQITVVAPQVYTVDSLGIFYGTLDRRVLELARRHNVKVMPLFVNEGFQQPGLRRLLADSAAQARAIETMVALCRQHGYWGMQFDVENINVQDRDRFTRWYARAARALHAAGFKVSVAVVPRTSDLPGATGYNRWLHDSWRGAFDLAALARAGDFISLMTYDQNTRRTPPGPVAGLPWMREAVEFALRSVPPEKLSLGVPLYGDHWYVTYDGTPPDRARTTGRSVSWAWGRGLAERAGATVRFAEPEPGTLELPASAVEAVMSDRTRWIAVTGASNPVGTVPDLVGIGELARGASAGPAAKAPPSPPARRPGPFEGPGQ